MSSVELADSQLAVCSALCPSLSLHLKLWGDRRGVMAAGEGPSTPMWAYSRGLSAPSYQPPLLPLHPASPPACQLRHQM